MNARMIRSPNAQGLRNACREVAENNWGFVYSNEGGVQQNINAKYAEKDVIRRRDANEVDEEDIEGALEELVDRQEAEKCREGVYFINPFGRKDWDKESLVKVLEEIFKQSRYVTEERLKENLDIQEVSISDDDLNHLFDVLKDRDYLKSGFSSPMHSYFKPGDSLTGHRLADLPPLSKQLKDIASNGVVSNSDLQSALGIKVDDRIVTELKKNNTILDLGSEESGRYLIDEDSCLQEHVESLVNRSFVQEIEETFEEANYVLKRSIFESELLENVGKRSNIVDVVPQQKEGKILESVREQIKQSSGNVIKKKQIDGVDEQCFVCEEKLDSFFDREARKIIRAEAGQTIPRADKPFVENDVVPSIQTQKFSKGGDTALESYFRDQISEASRKIVQSESLEQVVETE